MRFKRCSFITAIHTLLALSPVAHAQVLYNVTQIGPSTLRNGNSFDSCGNDINRNGDVVGDMTEYVMLPSPPFFCLKNCSSDPYMDIKGKRGFASTATGVPINIKQPVTKQHVIDGQNFKPADAVHFKRINASGRVLGSFTSGVNSENNFDFLSDKSGVVALNKGKFAAHFHGSAIDFNDKNQVLTEPWRSTPYGIPEIFVFTGGILKSWGTPGGYTTLITDINNKGQVVGSSAVNSNHPYTHAFIITPGHIKNFGPLPVHNNPEAPGQIYPQVINDKGQIAGVSTPYVALLQKSHAFVTNKGRGMIDLGELEPQISDVNGPLAMNNNGQIVGMNGTRPFVTIKGKIADLNNLINPKAKWLLERANAINDAGLITGCGTNSKGLKRAFLLTPIKHY